MTAEQPLLGGRFEGQRIRYLDASYATIDDCQEEDERYDDATDTYTPFTRYESCCVCGDRLEVGDLIVWEPMEREPQKYQMVQTAHAGCSVNNGYRLIFPDEADYDNSGRTRWRAMYGRTENDVGWESADPTSDGEMILATVAATLRQVAEWGPTDRGDLRDIADSVMTGDHDMSCPMCQETQCDTGCPLEFTRTAP